jgi:eukaryotic-like serine/threonine-protein kinase
MSEVWEAHDLELDRPVVLKVLGLAADRARFEREAQAVAGLSHPHICLLYDFGDLDGRPFMVLELLAGGTLEDRLSAGRSLPDPEAERIAREVASALGHAHAQGVLHRDVKPTNVLFDSEGRAKLADFGIARVGDASTLTEAGTLLGTAAYLSPEQSRGEPVTPATDVYSFGVILYRMLTGRLPFEADSPLEVAAMHATREVPPILSLQPDAPASLERVATRALAKRPEDRPADGNALLAELGEPSADEATQVLAPRPRRVARPPLAAGIALVVVAIVGAASAVLLTAESSKAPVATTNRPGTDMPTTQPATAPPPASTTEEQTTDEQTTAPTTTRAPTTTAATTTASPLTTTTSLPTVTEVTTTVPLPDATITVPTTTEETTTVP